MYTIINIFISFNICHLFLQVIRTVQVSLHVTIIAGVQNVPTEPDTLTAYEVSSSPFTYICSHWYLWISSIPLYALVMYILNVFILNETQHYGIKFLTCEVSFVSSINVLLVSERMYYLTLHIMVSCRMC